MKKTLTQRLHAAKRLLDDVEDVLKPNRGSPIHDAVFRSLSDLTAARGNIDHWLALVETRRSAFVFLTNLETQADKDDLIVVGGAPIKYQYARYLGISSYLVSNWALADGITGLTGRALCTPETARNPNDPAKLVAQFIKRDGTKKQTAAAIVDSVKCAFGWPIGLSYALRNIFVHEGGWLNGGDIFAGTSSAHAFRLSDKSWDNLAKHVEDLHGVDESNHRRARPWPIVPVGDLRELLSECESELDDALGVLLGSACGLIQSHVAFLLGED